MPVLTAAFSGLLLAFAFPPANVYWLAWFALVPLLVAVRDRRPLEAAGLGLLTGIVCGLVIVGPPEQSTVHYSMTPFLLLALVLAMTMAVVCRVPDRGRFLLSWPVLVTCAAIAIEWVSTWMPLPIHLGLTQHKLAPWPVVGIALTYFGIWILSVHVWLINAFIAHVHSGGIQRSKSPLILVLFILTVGSRAPDSDQPTIRIAAIQEMIEGARFAADSSVDSGDREQLTRAAARQGAKLIVQSELSLGTSFQPDREDDESRKLARELKVWLVAGFIEPGQPRSFNAAALIAPSGKVVAVHRKRHLFLGERNAYGRGETVRVVETELGRIGLAICFDTCFTDHVRDLAARGAQIVAVPNYDPAVPRGIVNWLHTAFMPIRAAESRVAIVRADANGLSDITDNRGRTVALAPLYKPKALVADVSVPHADQHRPLWPGDSLAYACMAWLLVAVVVVMRREPSAEKDSPSSRPIVTSH